MDPVEDKQEDESYLVSSDTEPCTAKYGDENHLFYDEDSNTREEVKARLSVFDNHAGDLSNIYQDWFLPKIKDKSHNFTKWLIENDIVSSHIKCINNPNCVTFMQIYFSSESYDSYQFWCTHCFHKESIRKDSIFEDLRCDLRSGIRILYGWVKGLDLEVMSSMLGLDRSLVGTLYNRAAEIAHNRLHVSPEYIEIGGRNSIILVDIYPHMLKDRKKLKTCTPILCIVEAESFPQRFWLEELGFWNKKDKVECHWVKTKIIDTIRSVVKRGSTLVLPNYAVMPLKKYISQLTREFSRIHYMDELKDCESRLRPAYLVLDTIWKEPISLCEEAQFYHPDYVGQFLIRNMWNEATGQDSFIMLIAYLVYSTRSRRYPYPNLFQPF